VPADCLRPLTLNVQFQRNFGKTSTPRKCAGRLAGAMPTADQPRSSGGFPAGGERRRGAGALFGGERSLPRRRDGCCGAISTRDLSIISEPNQQIEPAKSAFGTKGCRVALGAATRLT
jgi:hypothetical protein